MREGADAEALKACARLLAEGRRPLVVFPEGTWYRQNERLGVFQDGVGLVADDAADAPRLEGPHRAADVRDQRAPAQRV